MCIIGSVSSVTIISASKDSVSFSADSKVANSVDESPNYLRRARGTFTVPRSTVQPTPTPTKMNPHPAPAVALVAGAKGTIYLEITALTASGTSIFGPTYIRGAVAPLLGDEHEIELKWPDCAGIDDRHPVPVSPQRITVTGYALAMPGSYTVELFDSSLALPSQEIEWTGGDLITLALTKDGFAAFGVPYDPSGKLEIWPTAIEVTGCPDGGVLDKIDLRDQSLAWPVQKLSWSKPKSTLHLDLTSLACNRLGFFPDGVIAAAKLVSEADPNLRAAYETLFRASRAMERWGEMGIHINDSSTNREIKKLLARLGSHP